MRLLTSPRSLALLAALCLPGLAAAQVPQAPPPQGMPPQAVAQAPAAPHRFEISALTGYMFNTDISTGVGNLVIDNAQSFGVTLGYLVMPGAKLELSWIYSPTHVRFDSYAFGYPSGSKTSLDIHYFQIGMSKGFRRDKFEPFFGGSLGANLLAASSMDLADGRTLSGSDVWSFAIALGGGAKIWFSDRIALRLQGRLLMPIYFQGLSFWAGSGGSGVGVSGGIPLVQLDLSAGLTVAF